MDARATSPSVPAVWQRWLVGCAACAFVGATLWQVAGGRDDWPLSSFDMYSGLQGKDIRRTVLRGVSEQGEFDLQTEQTAPFGGARLRHLDQKLKSEPDRQAGFLRHVQERYEAQREARGWPVLQGIRSYSETWQIQGGLRGIETPERTLAGTLYLPTLSLLDRLGAERQGRGAPLPPRARPEPDRISEFEPAECADGCEDIADPNASGGRALRAGAGARLAQELELEPGRWFLFLRMRSRGPSGADRVSVLVDGARMSGERGAGNFVRALGHDAWVWASREPGARPLEVKVEGAGPHRLTIEVEQGGIEIDQAWFSRGQSELPTFNEAVQG